MVPNRRGTGLLLFSALTCGGHAIAYWPSNLPPGLPGGLDILSEYIPFTVYGPLWLLAAALGVWSAFRRNDTPGIIAAVMMVTLWGLAYLAGWFLATDTRQYVVASVYLGIAGLLYFWSRPDQVLVVHEDES